MQEILFYIFSALTLLCGLLVVFNPFSRNPVTSAMFLVLTIISMSGLFVLLKAFFLAAVQILVYAGAVIVLFLFVIMLLDVKEEERRRFQKFGTILGFTAMAGLAALIINTISQSNLPSYAQMQGKVVDINATARTLVIESNGATNEFKLPTLSELKVMKDGNASDFNLVVPKTNVFVAYDPENGSGNIVSTIRLGGGLGETKGLGKMLFTKYLLPFEIVSVLLLVAMVGCILLSKRDEPEGAEAE